MPSTRISRNVLCLAASVLLCGAPLYAQTGTTASGAQDSSGGQNTSGNYPTNRQGRTSTEGTSNSAMVAGNSSASSGSASAADKRFVQEAMEGDMSEIQLGQLAQQKATSDQVKQFGQKLVDDHTKLDEQIKPIAEQMGVTPPTDLSAKHKAVKNRLEGLSGAQFDKEFVKYMVSDHREDDQKFKKEESSAKDPALKNAVTQGEPVIAEHLRMAESMQKSSSTSPSGM